MPVRESYVDGEIYLAGSLWGTRRRLSSRDNLYVSVSNNPGGNNALGVNHFSISGSLQNGPSGGFVYKNNPSGFYDRDYLVGRLGFTPDSPENYYNRFKAATNPGRPAVRLPVFLAELRDIPGMVKEMGAIGIAIRDKGVSSVMKKADTVTAARANLAVQFGWQPFVQDLWKMATLTDAVEKRMKELERARRKGGSTRRMTLDGRTESFTYYDGDGSPYPCKRSVVIKAGGVWKQTYAGSADRTPAEVRRILLGCDAGNIAANVWEAMPWTWFTDQFLNIGQMLQAGNQTVATLERAWVTHVWESIATDKGWGNAISGVSPGTMRMFAIERFPVYPSQPTISFPILGTGQLSILGSLAVAKNHKVLLR